MTDLDLDGLAALAQAATPGPWEPRDIYALVSPTQIDGYAFPQDREDAKAKIDADRAFIAACDPDTILALVERVREAEAGNNAEYVKRVRAEARVAELEAERQIQRDVARAEESAFAARAERDRLRAGITEALADLDHKPTSPPWTCGVCQGHSPGWDGHARQCPKRLRPALEALLCSPTADTKGSDRG